MVGRKLQGRLTQIRSPPLPPGGNTPAGMGSALERETTVGSADGQLTAACCCTESGIVTTAPSPLVERAGDEASCGSQILGPVALGLFAGLPDCRLIPGVPRLNPDPAKSSA